MKFEFTPYHEAVSDEELIDDLVRVANELNANTLTQQQYINSGKYGIDKLLYRFQTWNGALIRAGLHNSLNFQHSLEDLYNNIERVWIAKGKQPARADMNNKAISIISSGAYIRRFGTWTNALRCFTEYIGSTDNGDCNESIQHDNQKLPKVETRSINLRLRWQVMRRDNFKCCCCGASPADNPSITLHVDHIIPWSKGGRTTLENLQTLCSNCNFGKGDLI